MNRDNHLFQAYTISLKGHGALKVYSITCLLGGTAEYRPLLTKNSDHFCDRKKENGLFQSDKTSILEEVGSSRGRAGYSVHFVW